MCKEKKVLLNSSRRLLLSTTSTEKQIAKQLYISETTLRQLYLATFGMPPRRYIKSVKLKKAQTLLRITNNSISEIAYIVGYINTGKFTEAFKRAFNMTPTEYRRCQKTS